MSETGPSTWLEVAEDMRDLRRRVEALEERLPSLGPLDLGGVTTAFINKALDAREMRAGVLGGAESNPASKRAPPSQSAMERANRAWQAMSDLGPIAGKSGNKCIPIIARAIDEAVEEERYVERGKNKWDASQERQKLRGMLLGAESRLQALLEAAEKSLAQPQSLHYSQALELAVLKAKEGEC